MGMESITIVSELNPRNFADPCGGDCTGGRDGGGEDMMQDFVRLHMMSILQPFAERLHELQGQVQQLFVELRQDRESAEVRSMLLDRHQEEIASLQSQEGRHAEQIQSSQADLVALKKEKNRLEGHHEMTKASLGANKEALAKLTASVEGLQQRSRESTERQQSLEGALGPMEKRIMDHLETRLDKQGRVCKDLNDRHAELQKACQHARTISENANLAIKKLNGTYESRKQEEDTGSAGLRERLAQLEDRLQNVGRDIREHADSISSTDREIQNLRTWTDQIASLNKLHGQHAEMSEALHAQSSRLNRVENDIAEIVGAAAAERKLQKEELDALEERFGSSLSDISKLRDKHRAHADLISSTARRVEQLETSQSGLAERAVQFDQELGNLGSWRQGASEELRQQSLSLAAAQGNLARVQNAAEVAGDGIRELRNEIVVDREALGGLGSRLDLCCKYFNGLGKGLQDTHRQIVGGDGILPPRLSASGAPALPTLPKAPKASLPPTLTSIGGSTTPRNGGSTTPRSATPRCVTPRGTVTPRSSTPRLR